MFSCYESLRRDFAKEISSFHCNYNVTPKISGDFRPSEHIFPETNRWVPLDRNQLLLVVKRSQIYDCRSFSEHVKQNHSGLR